LSCMLVCLRRFFFILLLGILSIIIGFCIFRFEIARKYERGK